MFRNEHKKSPMPRGIENKSKLLRSGKNTAWLPEITVLVGARSNRTVAAKSLARETQKTRQP